MIQPSSLMLKDANKEGKKNKLLLLLLVAVVIHAAIESTDNAIILEHRERTLHYLDAYCTSTTAAVQMNMSFRSIPGITTLYRINKIPDPKEINPNASARSLTRRGKESPQIQRTVIRSKAGTITQLCLKFPYGCWITSSQTPPAIGALPVHSQDRS